MIYTGIGLKEGHFVWDEGIRQVRFLHTRLQEYNNPKESLINGISSDNRIENLRFLCPNCHSQTPTYAGKKNKQKEKYKCASCGAQKLSKAGKRCIKCSQRNQEKIKWPSTEQLIQMVSCSSYLAIGRLLGVSDNAIRKRIKNHKSRSG